MPDFAALHVELPRDDRVREDISIAPAELTPIGRGAVSVVYAYTGPDGRRYAAKIFNSPDAVPWEKLEFLRRKYAAAEAASTTKAHFVAWPIAILHSDQNLLVANAGGMLVDRKPVGFLLRLLDKAEWLSLDNWIEFHLMSKLSEENDSLSRRLMILKNCAAALAELHADGIAMVDLKPANIFVNRISGDVCLTDVDSYRVTDGGKVFPATHISTGYILPKVFGPEIDLGSVDQTQDCYAYAVLVFQLLNYGIHPFQCVSAGSDDEISTNDAKAKHYLYAYGPPTPGSPIRPLRQSVHECWPAALRDMLSAAFTADRVPLPVADWERYFRSVLDEQLLRPCDVQPKNVRHIRFAGWKCLACSRAGAIAEQRAAEKPRPATIPVRPALSRERVAVVAGVVIGLIVIALLVLSSIQNRQRELEMQRRAEYERQVEAQRKADYERQLEAQRKADDARRSEAQRKAIYEQQLEAQRKADDERRLEAQRKADDARRQAAVAAQIQFIRGKAQEASRQAQAAQRQAQNAAAQATRNGSTNAYGLSVYIFPPGDHVGDRYAGEIRANKWEGYGVYTWTNGNRYEGEFHGGRMEGFGTMFAPNRHYYEGAWHDGTANGFGIDVLADGRQYQGEQSNGMWNGRGVLTQKDGSVLVGEWRSNSFVGAYTP
jgi:hypothetical protein